LGGFKCNKTTIRIYDLNNNLWYISKKILPQDIYSDAGILGFSNDKKSIHFITNRQHFKINITSIFDGLNLPHSVW